MNGVGRNIGVAILEPDIHHDKVMDVIQMIADLVCGKLSNSASNDDVSSSAVSYLVRNM